MLFTNQGRSNMRIVVLLFILTLISVCPVTLSAQLKGDPEAIELANTMIASIGGADIWSRARSLYIVEHSRHPRYGDGLVAEFWRDLQVPRETFTIENDRVTFAKGWTTEGGWTFSQGELKTKTKDEVSADEVDYWYGEIYVMYHRLAKGDPRIRLSMGEEDGQFIAWDERSDNKLGTFWLNVEGDLYRWRHGDESEVIEYIYGPHKQFGEISFPAWGTMFDGSWSFSYEEVRVLDTPPPSRPFRRGP